MQINYEDFFSFTKRDYKLSKEDYKAVEPYIQSAKAFASITDASLYIVDYYKEGFLYVSSNPLFLCGHTPETAVMEGYNFYFKNVPKDDVELLLELNDAGFKFYAEVPVEDKLKYFISYDIRLIQPNNRVQMVNHKLTPMMLDKNSNLWLAMCIVTRSSAKESGNIYISKYESKEIHYYDLSKKEWVLQAVQKLNEQEKEILSLAAQGLTNLQIAKKMYLSISTIKFHKNNLFKRLGVRNISEALTFCSNHKLI